MRLPKARIEKFQQMIFSWWKTHKRDLPWRRTHDPYKILVSEIMLQQTQVSRVLITFKEFISQFPTVHSLAHTTPAQVLRVWKGMGYNRRALYLQNAAKMIVGEYHNQFPVSERLLSKLPGVGTYTARAVLVFAFKKDVAAVDTNIRQIIEHYFYKDIPQYTSEIQTTADKLVPKGKSWEWHQALMDYGAHSMNKVKGKRKKEEKSGIPFRETNRFFRGRIMDLLREKSWNEKALTFEMNLKYDRSEQFISQIIDSLIRDSLVEKSRGTLRLPL